ncbi:hypothetical protein DNTS_027824, partial [Danionella cerebrum]
MYLEKDVRSWGRIRSECVDTAVGSSAAMVGRRTIKDTVKLSVNRAVNTANVSVLTNVNASLDTLGKPAAK